MFKHRNTSLRQLRLKRIRRKIRGNSTRPRLHVFRSNRHLYAQIIDDSQGKTLVAVSESELKPKKGSTKSQRAQSLGELIAQKALVKKVKLVVFDRGSYQYHGRIMIFAQAARQGGLQF